MPVTTRLGDILDNVPHEQSNVPDAPDVADFDHLLGLSGRQDTQIPERLETPPPEIMNQYRDPASLHGHDDEDPETGMRQYGSVEVYGGPNGWQAYEALDDSQDLRRIRSSQRSRTGMIDMLKCIRLSSIKTHLQRTIPVLILDT